MKQEQLLEAIGYVDEKLLEMPVRKTGRGVWRVALAAALIAALALTAAAVGIPAFKQGSNTMSNMISGSGRFAYDDGYIYYGVPGAIYKLEPESGKTERIPLSDGYEDARYLVVAETGLGYVSGFDTFSILSPEGTVQQIPVGNGNFSRLFVDGNLLYTENGLCLQRIHMDTGKIEHLVEDTHGYYVDETYIYALVKGNCFLRSGKDTVDFKQIPLSFKPAGMIADGEDLYFSEYQKNGTFQVIHYRDGVETPLPVYGFFMQILEGKLFYLDTVEKHTLKSYDLSTGEIAVITKNVFEFSVLADRYLCIDLYADGLTEMEDAQFSGNAQESLTILEKQFLSIDLTDNCNLILDTQTNTWIPFPCQ